MTLDRVQHARDALEAALPASHRNFYDHLMLSLELGDYVFVHAGVRPGIPLAEQSAHDLMWIRGEFLEAETGFERVVVHGHTVVDAPEVHPHRINIDTGAYASGRLTCLVLEGTTRRFLTT